MKLLYVLAILSVSIFFTHDVTAQSIKSDSLFLPGQVRQFQFNLDKPAQKVEELKYEISGDPIKGGLSRDGARVIMDNYKKGQRVTVKVTYTDGTTEVVTRSTCYIDPVRFDL